MITKWKFYTKKVVFGGVSIHTMWHESSHELVQDIIYRSGVNVATPCIKRMMRFHDMVRVGNTLIKMEEVPA